MLAYCRFFVCIVGIKTDFRLLELPL
jgi:hypothetical protein